MTSDTVTHFFTNQFGDEFLYEVNGPIFNAIGAEVTFEKYFSNAYFSEDTLYIIVGSDSGLLINYIQNKGVPNGSKYLFIEPDDVYEKVRPRIELDDANEAIKLCKYEEWLQTAETMSLNKYIYTERAHLTKSLAAKDAIHASYLDLYLAIDEQFTQYIWNIKNTIVLKGFIDRQLDNLADNHTPFINLRDKYNGKTCIILAGGPSLDESIRWIKENQDNLVLIAVSRIAKKLIKESITPDIIVTVDPNHGSFDVGKEALSFWKDSLLVQAYHADNYLAAQWRGKAVYLGHRFPWETKNNITNIIAVGPTVTQSSLLCAIEMGFDKIILCGVDNCYSKDGFTHTKGTIENDSGPLLAQVGTTVETNGGWVAETILGLKLGITAIEKIIQYGHDSDKKFNVINPSESAAKISGVDYIPLDKLPTPPKLPPTEKQVHLQIKKPTNSERTADLNMVNNELDSILKEIKEIQKLSREAIKQNTRAHKNMDIGSKKRVDKIEKNINTKFRKANYFITHYNSIDFLKRSIADHNRDFEMDEIKSRVDEFFTTYINSSKFLINRLADCKANITSRISELSSEPDFELIIKQWDIDITPGRAYIMEDRNSKNIPAKHLSKLSTYKNKFDELLQDSSSPFIQYIQRYRQNHDAPKNKADLLFGRKDLIRLKQLLDSLDFHKNNPAWNSTITLVSGYVNELEEQYEDALAYYNDLIDSEYQIDALKRILHISIIQKNNETALLALDCLAATMPIYMPLYANMQHLTGQDLDAINTYTEYLNFVPEDISAWLKLGKLYLDLNITSSAEWVFQQILEINPGNSSATKYLHDITGRN